ADHRPHAPEGLQGLGAFRRLLSARRRQSRSERHSRRRRRRQSRREHHARARRLGKRALHAAADGANRTRVSREAGIHLPDRRGQPVKTAARALAFASFVAVVWMASPSAQQGTPVTPKPQSGEGGYSTWRAYGGTSDSMQYSSLTQINKTNVARLEQAWFFPVPDKSGVLGFNPIVVDNTMYLMGTNGSIVGVERERARASGAH